MPLYLDIHEKIEGVTPEAVAEAHQNDPQTQKTYELQYLNHCYDRNTDNILRLCEARSRKAAKRVRR